jgi:hypothetical protein
MIVKGDMMKTTRGSWDATLVDNDRYTETPAASASDVVVGAEVSIDARDVHMLCGFQGNRGGSWFYRIVRGLWTQLAGGLPGFRAGDIVCVERSGSVVTARINDAEWATMWL